MALNGKSASMDIPKARDGGAKRRDNFTAVPANGKKHHGIPTPPNSISPNLPPRRSSRQLRGPTSPPSIQESDLELTDAPAPPPPQHDALNAESLDRLSDLDSAGAITPGLLAKHHLPGILLNHGPLAIRHVMGYLTTSVPGFSRITSAKARRLVVAALEGRASGADGGGTNGDVIFEKVGWGRWDARIKGQPPRDRHGSAITPPGSLPSSYSRHGLQVPGQRAWANGSEAFGTSVTAQSTAFTHSEVEDNDQDMHEDEADKMSLDGNEDGYASSVAPEPIDQDLGEGDVTDEEDWASIGAEALRARSFPSQAQPMLGGGRLYQPASYSYSSAPRYQSPAPPNVAQAAPTRPILGHNPTSTFSLPSGLGFNDSQERAAIEALMSLGSM